MDERQRGGHEPGTTSDTWLQAALRATLDDSAEGCPDPSEVAAFTEGRLGPTERERFEHHAAGCQRCLDLLGTLARVDERAAAGRPVAGPVAERWWRWLVPATVAATAAGVYLLVQPQAPAQRAMPEAPAYTQEATAAAREAPAAPQGTPAGVPTGKNATAVPEQPGGAADARLVERADQATGRAVAANEERPRPASPAVGPPAALPAPSAPPTPAPGAVLPAQPPPAPARSRGPERARGEEGVAAAPLAAQAGQAGTMPSKDVPVTAESRVVAEVPAERDLAKAEAAAPAAERAAQAGLEPAAQMARATAPRPAPQTPAAGALAAAHWLEVSAPGGTSRWRFGPGTAVSRSADGGRTWEPGSTPAGVTAASCPAPTTCWAVGRGGVVLLTTDGIAWRRVAFEDTADLVSVTAEDVSVATVVTASGHRYATRDGGATWVAAERR